jgi:hypothetical protein
MIASLIAFSLVLSDSSPVADLLDKIRKTYENPACVMSFRIEDLPGSSGKLVSVEKRVRYLVQAQRSGETLSSAEAVPEETFFEQIAAIRPGFRVTVPWLDLQGQGAVGIHSLGTADGLRWEARSTIPFALQARQILHSVGGDDPTALAWQGLGNARADPWTRSETELMLGTPPFEPVVLKELERHDPQTFGQCLLFLTNDYDPTATETLIHAYWHGSEQTRNMAGSALLGFPRKEAATAYLDMLRRGPYGGPAAQILQELGVKQAVPDLERFWRTSNNFWDADAAYEASRALRGLPRTDPVQRAFSRLVEGSGTSADLRKFTHADPTYATMLAIEGALRRSKGYPFGTSFAAARLLERLPTSTTSALIKRLRVGSELARLRK